MTPHCTSRQISEWLAGSRHPETERHLATCAECREAVSRFESLMSAFRREVHSHSGQYQRPDFIWTPPAAPGRLPGIYPVLAAASAVVLLALLLLVPARPSAVRPAIASRDSVLLEQVDHELSRSVPEPMEPLMLLVNREVVSRND